MASVKEVVKLMMGYNIPDATLDVAFTENGLSPGDERTPSDKAQTKSMDLTRASLIDFLITQPKSIRELDYQITQQDADALLAVRRRILANHGIVEDDYSSFQDLSNTH